MGSPLTGSESELHLSDSAVGTVGAGNTRNVEAYDIKRREAQTRGKCRAVI